MPERSEPAGETAAPGPALTGREQEVLARRSAGQSLAEIAGALGVEPRTVKFHLRNLYLKLGVRGRSQVGRAHDLARRGGGPGLFRPDRKLTDVLRAGRFTLSAEVTPPRNGAGQAEVLAQVERLIDAGAEFLAVTRGAGGSLRGGSLPIAQAIKEGFAVPAVAHFTCRDLLPEDVENSLVDHHYFGIRNLLALRGDPPDGQPEWAARPGGYRFAYQLIEQIRDLNSGRYLERPGGPPAGRAATDFCIGAAAHPEHPEPQAAVDHLARKVAAGARFAITQMVFDPDHYARFRDRCAASGLDVPILPGTRLLRSRVQADRTALKFGVDVPAALRRALPPALAGPDDAPATARAVDRFAELVARLRRLGAPGVHVFVTHAPSAAAALRALSEAGRPPR